MEKIKMFEDKPGSVSWMRVVTFIYFILVALPGSWAVLNETLSRFAQDNFSWEQMTYAITIFLVIHAVWITPKTIQKMLEHDGIVGKMIDKK
jgi:hypothetical protein